MANKTKISLIVPVKNEQGNILPLIKEAQEELQKDYDLELIYINDGSTDKTLDELKKAKKTIKNLKIINHDKSYGQSAAIKTGVLNSSAQIICMLDGDGQNNPADLPKMIEKFLKEKNDFTLIAGWRKKRQDTKIKKLTSITANFIRSKLLKDNTPDTGCGIKVFSKELFLNMPYFDHIHRFLPAMTICLNGKVISVPVSHRKRAKGVSNYGFWDRLLVGVFDIFGVVWLIKRTPKIIAKEIK